MSKAPSLYDGKGSLYAGEGSVTFSIRLNLKPEDRKKFCVGDMYNMTVNKFRVKVLCTTICKEDIDNPEEVFALFEIVEWL